MEDEEEELSVDMAKMADHHSSDNDESAEEEAKFRPASVQPALPVSARASAKSAAAKAFACTFCPKDFARPDHLTRHLTVHSGAKPHYCHLCRKGFPRPDKLRQHLLRVHDVVSAPDTFQCSCGAKFEQEVEFCDHRTAHPEHERVEEELGAAKNISAGEEPSGSGDEDNPDGDVKFEIVESEIKEEPGEQGVEPKKKSADKLSKKKRGRPGRKASKKPARTAVKTQKKASYVCKYCKESFIR